MPGFTDKLISFVFQGSSGFAQHVENCVGLAKYFEEQIRLRPSMFKPVLEEVFLMGFFNGIKKKFGFKNFGVLKNFLGFKIFLGLKNGFGLKFFGVFQF